MSRVLAFPFRIHHLSKDSRLLTVRILSTLSSLIYIIIALEIQHSTSSLSNSLQFPHCSDEDRFLPRREHKY